MKLLDFAESNIECQKLTEWERAFIRRCRQYSERDGMMSRKQVAALAGIVGKIKSQKSAPLLRIIGPGFCAAVIPGERAAPIIKYMATWSIDGIHRYCARRGWQVEQAA